MSCLGGVAGLGIWALVRNWDNPVLAPAIYLALFVFVTAYASVSLALAGPVPVARAMRGALITAVPIVVLMSVSGLRYTEATDLLDDPVMLCVAAVLILYSTPFLSVWLQDRRSWLRYASLFDAAWTMTVRYTIAWGFVGVFWLVAFLSNALLDLVDVDLIEIILRHDWARFTLSGAILGLGLAVTFELRDTISPYLFLRLLRLLVPVVLGVLAIFLIAVPFRGLTQLFGEFSAAGTLMGSAIVAIVLICTALDQGDWAAVQTRGLSLATQGLAVLLPLITILACGAVIIRVRQYGWTPDRVLAMSIAGFLFAYASGYCAAVLLRANWMQRIRQINVVMALCVITMSALWMTPALDAYRLSTYSQVSRFLSGRMPLDQLAVWEMTHEWGKAGLAGIDRLEAKDDLAAHDELSAVIAAARSSTNPFQFEQSAQQRTAPGRVEALLAMMQVRPLGATLSPDDLSQLPSYRLDQWLEGCRRTLPDGRSGCVFVRGAFSPSAAPDRQGIALYLDEDRQTRANHVWLDESSGRVVRDVFDPVANTWPVLPEAAIAQALDNAIEIKPSGGNALFIGDAVLSPGH